MAKPIPSKEDLANLSRLFQVRRNLLFNRRVRANELFKPVEEITAKNTQILKREYDDEIEYISKEIYKIKSRFNLRTHYRWNGIKCEWI